MLRLAKMPTKKTVSLPADLLRMYGTGVSVILSLIRLNQVFYSNFYF